MSKYVYIYIYIHNTSGPKREGLMSFVLPVYERMIELREESSTPNPQP